MRLYKELEAYGQNGRYPFHMPGHKRNKECINGDFPIERDITEINGFDDLHHAQGLIKEAQDAAARLYGTKRCLFSVNGSTGALLAAISAAVPKGGTVLLARNCHKAVYNAVYLRELNPIYIYPHEDSKLGINGGISPERVERYLEEHPEVSAVVLTSPTYDGVISDIARIAESAHAHGAVLIVDEAHGPHFRFSDYFPTSAAELGADLVVHSFHKTLPAMTQTAVLHICTDRVSTEKVRQFMKIYQTSSPSYVLMASMDACVEKLEQDAEQMYQEFTKNLEEARERLSRCKNIRLISPEMLDSTWIFDYDRSKILLTASEAGINGSSLHRMLREDYGIEMEMESETYVLGLTSVGDTREGLMHLCDVVEEIDARLSGRGERQGQSAPEREAYARMKQVKTISEASEGDLRRYRLEESIGKISGEFAYLYPPGTPVIVPGEQITGHFVRNMRRYMAQGLEIQGLSDSTNETICAAEH